MLLLTTSLKKYKFMYRPFENINPDKRVETDIEEMSDTFVDESSNIPDSIFANNIVEMIDKNSPEGEWMEILRSAEEELENLEAQIRLLGKGPKNYNGNDVSEDRREGMLKTLAGKINFQKSIIEMAKKNTKSNLE